MKNQLLLLSLILCTFSSVYTITGNIQTPSCSDCAAGDFPDVTSNDGGDNSGGSTSGGSGGSNGGNSG